MLRPQDITQRDKVDLFDLHRNVHAGEAQFLQLCEPDDFPIEISVYVALAQIICFPPKIEFFTLRLQVIKQERTVLRQVVPRLLHLPHLEARTFRLDPAIPNVCHSAEILDEAGPLLGLKLG